jgi:hypothetical protein
MLVLKRLNSLKTTLRNYFSTCQGIILPAQLSRGSFFAGCTGRIYRREGEDAQSEETPLTGPRNSDDISSIQTIEYGEPPLLFNRPISRSCETSCLASAAPWTTRCRVG